MPVNIPVSIGVRLLHLSPKSSIYTIPVIENNIRIPKNLKYKSLIQTTNMKSNKSPLRYPGGKTRACKIINDVLLKSFDISRKKKLISPFFGGGSFEFFLQNKYNLDIIANDKFIPLYTFWNTCKQTLKKIQMIEKLYKAHDNVDKKYFKKCREEILNITDDIEIATKYFIINRCSFSGATMSGGFSLEASKKRFTESSIERVKKLNLNKFNIYNEDFSIFIQKQEEEVEKTNKAEDVIIFLDPPYLLEEKKNKLYGNNGDLHENFNHTKLLNILINCKIDWIMTYNNCPQIKKLYKEFEILECNWSYGMNKSKKSSEIIIVSKKVKIKNSAWGHHKKSKKHLKHFILKNKNDI